MVHGENKLTGFDYNEYYKNAQEDIMELIQEYPFTKRVIIPSVIPEPIILNVVAVNNGLIHECNAQENDFKGEYSKELKIIIPYDYTRNGCKIYGASWIDLEKIPQKDHHFNGKENGKYLFCVGVPQSFIHLKNVILENVRTAESMMIAYESYQRGMTNKVDLIAYSHGEEGKNEYSRNRKRYRTI